MSLVGNLEDLSLPDILQIVSLSKKSGILTLERGDRQGKIFIREGRVIQTVSPRPGKTLGEILSARGLIKPDDLKKALDIQRFGETKELLGKILVGQKLIDQAQLEKIVQEQIEDAIVYFLSWKEGTFSFALSDIEGRGEISIDPHAFILEKGIDTQWLVLEGTRVLDERSRGGGSPGVTEEVTAGIEEAARAEVGEDAGEEVLFVDDDPIFRDLVKERLQKMHYRVRDFETASEALKDLKKPFSGLPPVVVTDIVYPTVDGRGFLGGLEFIEELQRSQPEIAVIAVTAYPDDKVKSRVAELGVKHFIFKPAGGKGEAEEQLKEFLDSLVEALKAVRGEETREPGESGMILDRDDREQLVDAIDSTKAAFAEQESAMRKAGLNRDEMSLLQDMMQELRSPRATSEIGLLILRFAAELLNRAVLFVVKGGNAVGLGGFGVESGAPDRAGGVRGITIPLGEPSLLGEVVKHEAAYRGPVVHTPWNLHLLDQLGGETPAEALAIPLVVSGKVRVILYGDNLPDNQPIPKTQALEIFLSQAGLTMERAILEKRLQEAGALAEPGAVQ